MFIRSDSGKSMNFNSSEIFRHLNGFSDEIGFHAPPPADSIELSVGWPVAAKFVQIET